MSDTAIKADEPSAIRVSPEGGVRASRIGVYTALGTASGLLPLPWVPDRIARAVRGAIAHDIAARHGVHLSPGARGVFADPTSSVAERSMIGQAVKFAANKVLTRFAPLSVLLPIRSGIRTFALAHLLDRYLERGRKSGKSRMDAAEAAQVRRLVESSLFEALRTEGKSVASVRPFTPVEDRDTTTQLVDGIIMTIAGIPEWLVARLDAAFDAALAREAGDVDE